MRHIFTLCLVAIFVFLTIHAPGQTSDVKPGDTVLSEADLRKKLADICDQVNAFYKAEHFPVPAPSSAGCSFSYSDNVQYKEKTGKFAETYQSHLAAELLATSGTVVSFFNWDADGAAYGPTAPLFAQRPPARWTEAHAIEVATKFADIFVKPWGVKLGQPTAQFFWPVGSPPQVAVGRWTVQFPRESLSGIPFAGNGVTVSLSEQYGPDSIGLGFTTEYDDVPITPIAQSRAVIEGRRGLDKIMGWGPAKSWYQDAVIWKGPFIKLFIVQPNDLLAQKSLEDLAFSGQHKGRLAWVVTYTVRSPTNPNIHGAITIYIDAKDGSFLGGMP